MPRRYGRRTPISPAPQSSDEAVQLASRGSTATSGQRALRTLSGRYREFWYALVAIAVTTAAYLAAYSQAGGYPEASGLVGHGIGVLGFTLMLMTETLYSIRKRVTDASWGSMAGWLRFHIFTGLVGPYMVLLHTAMEFQGLAGIAMLLTVVAVVSGAIGRYIYTMVPRTVDDGGSTVSAPETVRRAHRLAAKREALATWRSIHVPLTWALFTVAGVHAVAALYYATLQRW